MVSPFLGGGGAPVAREVSGVGDHIARGGVGGTERAGRVDPARVDDERQAKRLLEGRQAARKELGVSGVAEDAVLAVAPPRPRTFRVPPAVELEVAEADATPSKVVSDGEQRARVAERRLVAVVVGRTVVGPVAEAVERHVGVVGRADLAVYV